ncbi:hypothetical protein A1O3_08937 [Capronia epimyces CBS 606.96]|uniref:N-alpha-acetyltransferase 40 n=1 Tax=Capronia epimyces CBS 606.96 TaxID=1182542 RepID=W9XQ46_9EURO|nr:uncharacterized protein A1O3_08937 [Capronia epimyces CBS 606.96]EXJ79435.1 hypothetical protein A1O3_08937 [Capronia epimyces CBS 606.96]
MAASDGAGGTRRSLRSKAPAQAKVVEAANALAASDFFAKYDNDKPTTPSASLLDSFSDLQLQRCQADASHLPPPLFEQCLKLIEQTSAEDYQNSEVKWSLPKKRKEMRLPDMRYIVLVESKTSRLAGFISFMITYEDGFEVVYIYEIHFAPEWQGQGLGKKLMQIVEAIGQNVGVTKAMLTVFKTNTRAVNWYYRLGYREDEFSPGPRRLRNGTIKEPSHIILSKRLND